MSRKPRPIQSKRTIFIACEGFDEIGFLRYLRSSKGRRTDSIAVEFDNAKGGSNVEVVGVAHKLTADTKYAFMDTDRYLLHPTEKPAAESLASSGGIEIIYSKPNFEHLILGAIGIYPRGVSAKEVLLRELKGKSPQEPDSYQNIFTLSILRSYAASNREMNLLLSIFGLL